MHNILLDRSEGPKFDAGWDGFGVSATRDCFSQGLRRVIENANSERAFVFNIRTLVRIKT